MSFKKYASVEILEVKPSHSKHRVASLDKFADWDQHEYKTDDFLYVRVRAISSRNNLNNDSWPAAELAKSYRTFVGKPLFVEHQNSDPKRTRGVIVDAKLHQTDEKTASLDPYYSSEECWSCHKPPTWIELLLEIDAKTFPKFASAIIKGEIDGFSMGCFVPGTPITMADGTRKPIEEIELGDKIVTHTGQVEPVTYVMEKDHSGVVYSVSTYGQSAPMVLTEEHPVWIRRIPPARGEGRYKKSDKQNHNCICGREFFSGHSLGAHIREAVKRGDDMSLHSLASEDFLGWVNASEVQVGDFVLTPALKASEAEQHPGSYPFARLLGYYLAEGNMGWDRKRKGYENAPVSVEWTFSELETEYIDEVRMLLEAMGYNMAGPYFKNGAASVRCNSPELAAKFLRYGGQHSAHKVIHPEVMGWSEDNKQALLASYWNGDGHYAPQKRSKKNRVEATTVSKKLAEQIHTLAVSCKHPMTPPVRQHSPAMVAAGSSPKYVMQTALGDVVENHWASAERSAKARTSVFTDEQGLWRRVTSIGIREYKGKVYNFDVEGDDSYVAQDVAVHNCNVERSVCSHCDNVATSPAEFCKHIASKGAYFDYTDPESGIKTARKAVEHCHDVTFFELSGVVTPADPTALTVPNTLRHASTKEAGIPHWFADALVAGALPASVGLNSLWDKYRAKFGEQPASPEEVKQRIELAGVYDQNRGGYSELPVSERIQSSKTADHNEPPQYEKTTAPEKVDTLRQERTCPVCGGADLTDGHCDICGYSEAPEGFDNPDLEKAQEVDQEMQQTQAPVEVDEENQNSQQMQASSSGLNHEDILNSRIATADQGGPRGRIRIEEKPALPTARRASDKPKDAKVVQNHTKPVESSAEKESMSDKQQKVADGATPHGGADTAADKRVDVEGVGAVMDNPMSGTEHQDVAKDVNVKGDHTDTWSDMDGQTEAVTSDSFPASGDGVKASSTKEAGPSMPDHDPARVDLEADVANEVGDRTKTFGETHNQAAPITKEVGDLIDAHKASARKHALACIRLAEAEIDLGLTSADDKYNRVSELEDASQEELDAQIATLARVRTAGLRKQTSVRKTAATGLPSLQGKRAAVEPSEHAVPSSDQDITDAQAFM